jgi:formylglycine-generating enzyme required for sulfatase activity
MYRAVSLGFLTVLLVSLSAFALTGSGDSAVGALDTVEPQLSALAVEPGQAAAGDTVTITFTVSESLAENPLVRVNGAEADFVSEESGDYTYAYLVQETDPLGMASVEVNGSDLVGNPGNLSSAVVLEIVEAPPVPLHGWLVFAALLAAGVVAVARRRWARGFLIVLALLAAPMAPAQVPAVSNVAFVQQPDGAGGTEVVVTYDLDSPNGPSDITVSLSKDGGVDGFVHPVTSVTGDLTGVTTGTARQIVWDIATDYPNEDIPNGELRVTADDGMYVGKMIHIAAGDFDMGRTSAGDDAAYGQSEELPVHTVMLSAYEIGKYEVTNQQVCDVYNWANGQGYFTTVDATTATAFGQELLDLDSGNCHIQFSGGVFSAETRTGLPGTTTYSMADHPVVMISWYGAVAYCNWLSEIQGLTPVYNTGTWTANFANNGYRLPTEAQWERAAAWDGSKHWIYGFTSDTLTGKDRANCYDSNPNCVNPLGLTGYPYTSSVGWFDGVNVSPNGSVSTVDSPSPVGCYDMSGNVFEWCHDWYDGNYYTTGGPPWDDPAGPGSGTDRVLRGGSWHDNPEYCRSASRSYATPDDRSDAFGFRVVRTP